MKKVVLNKCYGGYGLSKAAYEFLGIQWDGYGYAFCDDRSNPDLIRVVETLGENASGNYSCLVVIDIDDDVGDNWHINDYDGWETVHENHRSW